MKLLSLQVGGSSPNSWSSGKLTFGNRVTQLFGSNGCGKTPMVQSIVFALGYKIAYRDDILERCDHVTLEVAARGREYAITRRMSGPFVVTVEEPDGPAAEFISEREYSRFLFSLWGLDDPVLTTVGNEATHIYSPHILPLFYLDQDHGYAHQYFATSRFIRDQYPETMRLIYGLLPKHPFDKRRQKIELNDRLDYLDRVVRRSETIISELTGELDSPRRPALDIERELQTTVDGLEQLRASGGVPEQINVELDSHIADLQQRIRALASERSELEARVRGLAQIKHEIEVETDTLSLNEEARRVFASFDTICANENCGLFVRSSMTYGKSLLYLKDQIKDLDRINLSAQRRLEEITTLHSLLEAEFAEVQAGRANEANEPSVATLVGLVSQLTEKVISLRRAKQIEEELTRVESEYVEKLLERERIQTRLENLEGHGNAADLDLLKTRNALQERIKHWLTILRTSNVSLDVTVDTDFNVTFGGQKVERFKGSTLTRIILAIRTAAFDLVTRSDRSVPRFFILDTPRQQDISREDLAFYIEQLHLLASERSVQVVYSTTNHRYELGDEDEEWTPHFPGVDHPMFLGVAGSEDQGDYAQ